MDNFLKRLVIPLGLALGALTFGASGASALPMYDPGVATAANESMGVEKTYWVCGPYRCWWRPNYYYGWRRHYWHRPYYGWHRRYWHRRHYWHRPYYRRWHRRYHWRRW